MSTTTPDGTHTPPGPQRFRANPGNMLRAGLAEAPGSGPALIKLVTSWHQADATALGLDLQASKYTVLSRSSNWQHFQLSTYPLDLYGPELLNVSPAANWDDLQTGNRPMAWS